MEEKEGRITRRQLHLLYSDLCMRAPFLPVVGVRNDTICDNGEPAQKEYAPMRLRGVHAGDDYHPYSGYGVFLENSTAFYDLDSWNIKPYLRPLWEMTEEEKKVYDEFKWHRKERYPHDSIQEMQFLLSNHFDIFNLLNEDLAIKLTPENNPYEPIFKVGDKIISKFEDMTINVITGINGGYYELEGGKVLLICRQCGWKLYEGDEWRSV